MKKTLCILCVSLCLCTLLFGCGAELFLLTFEGFELSCRFVLEDNTLTGPCSPYIVELQKDS